MSERTLAEEILALTPGKPDKRSPAQIMIDEHRDIIRAQVDAGVGLRQIFALLRSRGLAVEFSTFKAYLYRRPDDAVVPVKPLSTARKSLASRKKKR